MCCILLTVSFSCSVIHNTLRENWENLMKDLDTSPWKKWTYPQSFANNFRIWKSPWACSWNNWLWESQIKTALYHSETFSHFLFCSHSTLPEFWDNILSSLFNQTISAFYFVLLWWLNFLTLHLVFTMVMNVYIFWHVLYISQGIWSHLSFFDVYIIFCILYLNHLSFCPKSNVS